MKEKVIINCCTVVIYVATMFMCFCAGEMNARSKMIKQISEQVIKKYEVTVERSK